MFEMMNQQSLSVGAGRRREVALETMREAHVARDARHVVGLALLSFGQRVGGEMPTSGNPRVEGDCV